MLNLFLNQAPKIVILGAVLSMLSGLTSRAEEAKEKPMFTESGHTTDELAVVKARIAAKQAVLLDVREEDEWEEGHLKDARLVPLSRVKDGQIPPELQELFPKDRPIYLHCRSGGRVLKCASVLKAKGYDLRPLKAGFEELAEFGFTRAESEKPQ